MKLFFLTLVLFLTLHVSHAQNYLRYLDKYGYEVKDTSKHGFTFFELIQGNGNAVLVHRFSKDSVKITEKAVFFDSLENETGSSEKAFYTSRKTKYVIRKVALKNETLTKYFHENGAPKSEVLLKGEEIISEKYFNTSGEEIDKPEMTLPSPHEGAKGWYKYLSSELSYPTDARSSRAEGKVILEFDLDREGRIHNLRIVNLGENHFSLEKEAMRVLEEYPYPWNPALENGKPVESIVKLPIAFKLS